MKLRNPINSLIFLVLLFMATLGKTQKSDKCPKKTITESLKEKVQAAGLSVPDHFRDCEGIKKMSYSDGKKSHIVKYYPARNIIEFNVELSGKMFMMITEGTVLFRQGKTIKMEHSYSSKNTGGTRSLHVNGKKVYEQVYSEKMTGGKKEEKSEKGFLK